jgi:hypothetical protein
MERFLFILLGRKPSEQEEMKMMKKTVVAISAVILLTLIPLYLWSEERPEGEGVRCEISFSLSWDPGLPTWEGTISGDIEGEFDINNVGANFDYPKPNPSPDEYVWEVYWEEWVIETDDGTITSIQAGVWSFETFRFLANGPVVDATGKWEHLIGSTMYVSGVTTEYPVDPPTPVTGKGELWID